MDENESIRSELKSHRSIESKTTSLVQDESIDGKDKANVEEKTASVKENPNGVLLRRSKSAIEQKTGYPRQREKESVVKGKKQFPRSSSQLTIGSAESSSDSIKHPESTKKIRPKTSRVLPTPKEVETQTEDVLPASQRSVGIQVLRRHCGACSNRRPLTAPIKHPPPRIKSRPPLRPPWLTEVWVGLPVSSQGPYPQRLRFVSLYKLAYGSKKNLKDMLA